MNAVGTAHLTQRFTTDARDADQHLAVKRTEDGLCWRWTNAGSDLLNRARHFLLPGSPYGSGEAVDGEKTQCFESLCALGIWQADNVRADATES